MIITVFRFDTRLLEKGWTADQRLNITGTPVGGNNLAGTVVVDLNGNSIATDEIYFTALNDGTDNDTQWTHVMLTFGSNGMRLYINGELKGTNSYTGGISQVQGAFKLPGMSGYFDEFYIFDGQVDAAGVQGIYNNLIANKNLDGSNRDCDCETGSIGDISGTVYTDSNTNDSYDTGTESGIGSITVSLLNDADGSSILTTSTAADGSYSFSSLNSSLTYRVEVDVADSDFADWLYDRNY